MSLTRCAEQKPARGTALLASRKRRADRVADEQKEMQAALKRDGRKCRVPRCEFAGKHLPIDPCHIVRHRGMGGNPAGDRTTRDQILSMCRAHHGQFDATQLDVQAQTMRGTDAGMDYYRHHPGTGRWELFASEQWIKESVRVGL